MVASSMHVDLAGWPAVAVQLAPSGEIASSNGHLEALVGESVVGRRLASLLDEGPSSEKWEAALAGGAPSSTLELIFRVHNTLIAPRAFSLLRSDELVLVEHPVHPRLAELAAAVDSTNTDLATAQRALVIERARLAAALKELERSNQALDEFAHAVSHDLKAPLRAIKDAGEIIGDPLTTADERQRYAARITDLVGRMRRMIDGVFEYARAGRAGSHSDTIDTRQAIAELVEYLNPPASVKVTVDPALPTIVGDRAPFDQVFRNLLSNAFAYRRATDAHVEVTCRRQGDTVEIAVTDNGPGISESQLPRIWRLFHTSRPGEGTGIGLAVVKRLVEAQGGTIAVDSTEGVGSTFRVRWPMKPRHGGGASVAGR
jgi:signal transduction histidine kinase